MSVNLPSSSDYEAQAKVLRAEMGSTIDQLRFNLTPSNLRFGSGFRSGFAGRSGGFVVVGRP